MSLFPRNLNAFHPGMYEGKAPGAVQAEIGKAVKPLEIRPTDRQRGDYVRDSFKMRSVQEPGEHHTPLKEGK